MTGVSCIGYMLTLVLMSHNFFKKIFRSKKKECQGWIRFKAFLEEDSSAVIAQLRKVGDQMHVINLKRDLEKEKDELHSNKINQNFSLLSLSSISALIFDFVSFAIEVSTDHKFEKLFFRASHIPSSKFLNPLSSKAFFSVIA